MDVMAVQYARELALWGIETSIVAPGAFTEGTNHFAHSGTPADKQRAAEYEAGPTKGYGTKIQAFAAIVPPEADAGAVADATLKSWTPRLASARSAYISIRRRPMRTWHLRSWTVCVQNCCIA
jgi:NAD(P)-dependent dehydrogenase (short-subunit alcohol dehydrogenase family)